VSTNKVVPVIFWPVFASWAAAEEELELDAPLPTVPPVPLIILATENSDVGPRSYPTVSGVISSAEALGIKKSLTRDSRDGDSL
jgi:hypothetical protein